MKAATFRIGDCVWYQPDFGSGVPVRCRITGSGEKNGEPVLHCELIDVTDRLEKNRWGYLDQFTAAT